MPQIIMGYMMPGAYEPLKAEKEHETEFHDTQG